MAQRAKGLKSMANLHAPSPRISTIRWRRGHGQPLALRDIHSRHRTSAIHVATMVQSKSSFL